MKIILSSKKISGQVLLVCLGIATVLGISLAGIFTYSTNQYAAVARSQGWNESLVLAEAGVEDALQMINKNTSTGNPSVSWTTSAASDGWTNTSANVYRVTRTINSNYYDVYIFNSNSLAPTIRSTGVKRWLTTFNGGKGNISRTVEVTTSSASVFQAGLLAKDGLTLNGNVLIDSFNSQIASNSNNGKYDPTKRRAGGNIATMSTNTIQVTVGGSVDVYGKVYGGPGDTLKINGGGSVGSLTWVNGGNSGAESGWFQSDMNLDIPDAPAPPNTGLNAMPSKTSNNFQGTNGISNSYLLSSTTSTNWIQSGNLSLSSSDKILINGKVKLHLNGNFSMSGSAQIIIGTNSSLTIYSSGSLDFSGGGVANSSGFATNLYVYGQANNTSIKLAGGTEFAGVIYAPYAAYSQVGGGSTALNMIGSVVAKSITLSGKSQVHYDESLVGSPSDSNFYVASWKEK